MEKLEQLVSEDSNALFIVDTSFFGFSRYNGFVEETVNSIEEASRRIQFLLEIDYSKKLLVVPEVVREFKGFESAIETILDQIGHGRVVNSFIEHIKLRGSLDRVFTHQKKRPNIELAYLKEVDDFVRGDIEKYLAGLNSQSSIYQALNNVIQREGFCISNPLDYRGRYSVDGNLYLELLKIASNLSCSMKDSSARKILRTEESTKAIGFLNYTDQKIASLANVLVQEREVCVLTSDIALTHLIFSINDIVKEVKHPENNLFVFNSNLDGDVLSYYGGSRDQIVKS